MEPKQRKQAAMAKLEELYSEERKIGPFVEVQDEPDEPNELRAPGQFNNIIAAMVSFILMLICFSLAFSIFIPAITTVGSATAAANDSPLTAMESLMPIVQYIPVIVVVLTLFFILHSLFSRIELQ